MSKVAGLSDRRPKQPNSYKFVVIVSGVRAPIDIALRCECDAEAGLIALSLTTSRVGAEAWRGEKLVYSAPPRSQSASWETSSSVAH